MIQERHPTTAETPVKLRILLMDSNPERLALRSKIMATHGVDVTGASDLQDASSMWDRDTYDMVLLDLRRDYHGCLAWRNEIKKAKPDQVVAFLVGRPRLIDLLPLENSYVAETSATEWGDSLRRAIRESCDALPERNGLVAPKWQISSAKRMHAMHTAPERTNLAAAELEPGPRVKRGKAAASAEIPDTVPAAGSASDGAGESPLTVTTMENE